MIQPNTAPGMAAKKKTSPQTQMITASVMAVL
jgi:hypothetical protein